MLVNFFSFWDKSYYVSIIYYRCWKGEGLRELVFWRVGVRFIFNVLLFFFYCRRYYRFIFMLVCRFLVRLIDSVKDENVVFEGVFL